MVHRPSREEARRRRERSRKDLLQSCHLHYSILHVFVISAQVGALTGCGFRRAVPLLLLLCRIPGVMAC